MVHYLGCDWIFIIFFQDFIQKNSIWVFHEIQFKEFFVKSHQACWIFVYNLNIAFYPIKPLRWLYFHTFYNCCSVELLVRVLSELLSSKSSSAVLALHICRLSKDWYAFLNFGVKILCVSFSCLLTNYWQHSQIPLRSPTTLMLPSISPLNP